MKSTVLSSSAWLLTSTLCTGAAEAFVLPREHRNAIIPHRHRRPVASLVEFQFASSDNECGSSNDSEGDAGRRVPNDLGLDIVRGVDAEISDEQWDDIESGAPSRWMVMKDLLGINIFTYILAAIIIFFLSMNAVFGPGWLGQSLGWEDVGTFTKTSDSLPLNVDVSGADYLL